MGRRRILTGRIVKKYLNYVDLETILVAQETDKT